MKLLTGTDTILARIKGLLKVIFLGALIVGGPAQASQPGVVVANTGGKSTFLFREWQEFRHAVDEKSKGSIALDYLIFGESGNSAAMLQAVKSGKAQIAALNCQGVIDQIPELGVTQLPYLFSNVAEADYVFDHNLTPLFTKIFDEQGLVLLQWQDMGWLDIYAKAPVDTPAMLSGHEVRTVPNPVINTYLQNLGAHPVPLSLNDLSSRAQADKIFASLGTVTFFALKAQPLFKYFIRNDPIFGCGAIVANKQWYQSLGADEQAILQGSFTPRNTVRHDLLAAENKTYDDLTQAGTIVMQPTAEQHNSWAAAGLPLYTTILGMLGGRSNDIYQAIKIGKSEYLQKPGPDDVPMAYHN